MKIKEMNITATLTKKIPHNSGVVTATAAPRSPKGKTREMVQEFLSGGNVSKTKLGALLAQRQLEA